VTSRPGQGALASEHPSTGSAAATYSLAMKSAVRDHALVLDSLYLEGDEVPSPETVAVWIHLGQLRPERIPFWAAHWLVRGYDGEHLIHLAGLHGDDPREVRDALPDALRDCGVQMPESDVAAAEIVFMQLARAYLRGTVEATRVMRTVGAVLAWSGYPETIIGMPLGHLLYIDDEWDGGWGRTRQELVNAIRQLCEEQLRIGPATP
jgi:hypothetical protein